MPPQEIVVTGAGGVLGRHVTRALQGRGAAVLGLGRGAAPADFPGRWADIDLNDSDALRAVLRRGAVVVHAASDPLKPGADVRMAGVLARAAREAEAAQVVFVQVAGVGAAALKASRYYRDKHAAEALLRDGPVPCSTFRATQFHELIDRVFHVCSLGPLLLRPPFRLQPVDVAFVAERLADHVFARDRADVTVCGPEALSSREMASAWIASRDRPMAAAPVPALGLMAGFAHLEAVAGVSGGRTWRAWLSRAAR